MKEIWIVVAEPDDHATMAFESYTNASNWARECLTTEYRIYSVQVMDAGLVSNG